MRCRGCGVDVRAEAKFCDGCGARLDDTPSDTAVGAAVVRLYERYAELLPDDRGCTAAQATASAVAAHVGRIEIDRLAATYGPTFEIIDRRILGTWSTRGVEEGLR